MYIEHPKRKWTTQVQPATRKAAQDCRFGMALPRSHRLTALRVTPSLEASDF
jgi:hypothetical protein